MCGNLFEQADAKACEKTPPTSSHPNTSNRFLKSDHSVGRAFTAGLLCATNDFQRIREHLSRSACDGPDGEVYSGLVSVQRRWGQYSSCFRIESFPHQEDASSVRDRTQERHRKASIEVQERHETSYSTG